ncbi:MAG: hypothetical protein AB9891_02770 [Anaerolineaceae bacterium]
MSARRLISISSASLQFLLVLVLAFSSLSATTGAVQAASPGITIVSVVPDVSVTVLTNNFPANQLFNVRMGDIGSLGVNGTIVATTNSGAGGSFQATYNIPDNLKGMAQISIRMESDKGFYAYNYFENKAGGTTTTTTTSSAVVPAVAIPQTNVTPIAGYSGVPTFSITAVQQDNSVKILTYNFPPNQLFTVKMGATGTQAADGVIVSTTNSGAGGSFAETYAIPEALKGTSQIALRLECPAGYVAYNVFQNTVTQTVYTAGTTSSGYKGIPTFIITSVTPNTSVSIQTNNFPLNKDFTVRMGAYGTLGEAGVIVTTTNSGASGSFTATYEIPPAFRYNGQIAIRLESPDGYYAYNWFGNFAPAPVPATAVPAAAQPVAGSTPVAGETPSAVMPTAAPTAVLPVYTGVPSFTVTNVIKDTSITIQAVNFPPNQTFKVLMGAYGTSAVGGTVVTSTTSDEGGAFISTYEIPAALRGVHQIAMRMESPTGYFAYNYFFNITTP